MQFEWDPKKAAQNEIKHGVSFDEAMSVLVLPMFPGLPAAVTLYDENEVEDRWISIGYSARLNLLVVVHCERDKDTIRIISARKATPKEREDYEKGI
jgi:uncharacterized protein